VRNFGLRIQIVTLRAHGCEVKKQMETLWRDIRYSVRLLVKNKVVTLIALAALALGIGASTAIFSVINAVLLKGLPYKDASRLVLIWEVDAMNAAAFGGIAFVLLVAALVACLLPAWRASRVEPIVALRHE